MDFLFTLSGLCRLGKLFFRLLLIYMFVASYLIAGVPTAAALEEADESSVKAPRAPYSLLLDCISIDSFAVAVGERGHILISGDNGKTWRQVDVPTRATLTGVFFLNRKLGWVVGHDAEILRTDDGGNSWSRLYNNPNDERPLFDVWFRDADYGIAVGAYGLYLETRDGGQTWNERVFEPLTFGASLDDGDTSESGSVDEWDKPMWDFHLNQIIASENGYIYMAAEAGNIFRSDDEGKTWMAMPSPYNGSFFGCQPLKGDVVLFFGLRGHLFRSEDAGENWKLIKIKTQASLTRGLCLDSGHIIVTGLGGVLLVSNDGGESFTLKQQPNRKSILKAVKTDDGGVILAGSFGLKKLSSDDLGLGEDLTLPVKGK